MTRKPSTITTVAIGAPLADLPRKNGEPRRTPPAEHWVAVAAAAREAEGQWLPITIPGKSASFYTQSASCIRNSGKTDGRAKTLYSFRSGGYDAEVIDGQLYVRYAPQPTLTAVPRAAKGA